MWHMADELLHIESRERVRMLTLNRPAARNALSSDLVRALSAALIAADADADVSVVVLTGTDPAFCAGIDLKELARDREKYLAVLDSDSCIRAVPRMSKPIVGAINGATFTGGLELALGCDLLIASERAVFADTHLRVGVLPAGGMTARLPRVVGPARARRMSLTGEIVDATEALRIGLVTEVVPHDQLLPRAWELAAVIAQAEPRLLRALKQQYTEGDASIASALTREREIAQSATIAFEHLDERREAVMKHNRERL